MRKMISMMLVMIAASPIGLAAAQEPPRTALEPLEKMAALAALKGRWELIMASWSNGAWQEVGRTEANVAPDLYGLFLQARIGPPEGTAVIMSFYYHQHWDKYMVTTIDQSYGALSVELGQIVDGDLIVDSTHGEPTFPTPEGKLHFRTTFYDVQSAPSGWLIESSIDGGESWAESFKISISRATTATARAEDL